MTERNEDRRFRTAPGPSKWPPAWVDYKKPHPTTTVVLSCGHSNTYDDPAPAQREPAYCRRCRDYRRVTKPANNNPTED